MRVIGVDPGRFGALALLDGDTLVVEDMPTIGRGIDAWALCELLVGWGQVDRVAVESVHAMPRQGVSSSFNFGFGAGVVEGVLAALERPMVYVVPTTWTRGVGRDKDVHRRRACELWPAQAHLFSRKKDDGRADAALIARWAAQISKGDR